MEENRQEKVLLIRTIGESDMRKRMSSEYSEGVRDGYEKGYQQGYRDGFKDNLSKYEWVITYKRKALVDIMVFLKHQGFIGEDAYERLEQMWREGDLNSLIDGEVYTL
jgi:flagellar biosynthesis/type III secretory pathway protein FliH